MQGYKEELVCFSGEKVYLDGFVTLHVTVGNRLKSQTIRVDFLVVDCSSAYNVILGRPTLNKIRAIVSTACLTMKFFSDDGQIATIRANKAAAHRCYNASLEVVKKKKTKVEDQLPSLLKVMLIDLDVRGRQETKWPKPDRELEEVQIGPKGFQTTRINNSLSFLLKEKLVAFLRENMELFAWTTTDMPRIDPNFMSHRLSISPDVRPIAQKRRKMSSDKAQEVQK